MDSSINHDVHKAMVEINVTKLKALLCFAKEQPNADVGASDVISTEPNWAMVIRFGVFVPKHQMISTFIVQMKIFIGAMFDLCFS